MKKFILTAVAFMAMAGTAKAQTWGDIATSGALINNSVCITDGQDIICDGNTMTFNGAASVEISGSIIVGDGSEACVAGTEGAMRYVTASKVLEICDGSSWSGIATTSGGGAIGIDDLADGMRNSASGTIILGHEGSSITSGIRNTALGENSLAVNTSGGYNVATGNEALYSNTEGHSNVATGFQSLRMNTTGHSNVATGGEALSSNTTGVRNVATGVQALNANTNGGTNVAIGFQSLYNNTTASGNVASGAFALNSNSTGSNNVASGYGALRNSTGSTNTGIGHQAGTTQTSGNNNIALGANVQLPDTTGSNQLNIGNVLYGNLLGDGSISISDTTADGTLMLDVEGQVGATEYCDENGANCTSAADIAAVASGGTIAIDDLLDGASNSASGTVFLGENAGILNTERFNTGVGYRSLRVNSTGRANTALGYVTLSQNTTGRDNVAVGSDSLYSNTSASYNTSIGSGSMLFSTTGGYNTSVGSAAMRNNTTGARNVAVGRSALTGNTTGSDNTGLGYNAANNQTAGDNNIAIGANVQLPNTTGSNQLNIGNLIGGIMTSGSEAVSITRRLLVPEICDETGNNCKTTSAGLGANAIDDLTDAIATTSSRTVFLGNNSGTASTGTDNVSVGNAAMRDNTTGGYNVAIGAEALRYNTTGSSIVAIGYGAMAADTTPGNEGIAIGRNAMYNNSGSDNVAIGAAAMFNNNNGLGNVALGKTALRFNTDGFGNTAIGNQSMHGSASLSMAYNTALGGHSLRNNSSGGSNTALGYQSLYNNTTGIGNVAVGRGSQYSVNGSSTGSYNTSLGYEANNALTTGDYNITIGANTDAVDPAGSNQLNIGNTIYGDLANDRIAIGDTAFSATLTLDVSGSVGAVQYCDEDGANCFDPATVGTASALSDLTDVSVTAVSSTDVLSWNATSGYWEPTSFQDLVAVPTGLIAAFNGTCPNGWSEFTGARDRFLVGANNTYSNGDTGGADTVALTEAQMPAHSHRLWSSPQEAYHAVGLGATTANRIQGIATGASPMPGSAGASAYYDNQNGQGSQLVEDTGTGTAHENRPPYFAVTWCRKDAGLDPAVATNSDLEDLQNVTGGAADGQVLVWNNGASQWQPGTVDATAIQDADNDTKIQVEEGADDDTIRFDTAGAQRMMIDNTGNVGIGTSTPPTKFFVADGSGGFAVSDVGRVFVNHVTNTAASQRGATYRATDFIFQRTGATESMRIDSTGDIGIGDDSPDGTLKLDVEGQVGATEYCDENGANCTSAADIATAASGGANLWSDEATHISYTGDVVVEGDFQVTNPSANSTLQANAQGTYSSILDLTTPSNSWNVTSFGTGSANAGKLGVRDGADVRLAIDTAGNVGIGTNAPEGKMHILEGDSAATPNTRADALFIENNGETGITLATPNNSEATLRFADPENDSAGYVAYNHTADSMRFSTAATERMVIAADGKVGIGQDTPLHALHIKNAGAYIALEDTDDVNGSYSTISSHQSGNVYYDADFNNTATVGKHVFRADGATKTLMILENDGRLNAAQYCDISGNNCSTASDLANAVSGAVTSINDLSDAKHDTDDYSSLFLGNGAGANDDGTDNLNVGVGKNALNANTTGRQNVAIGQASMSSNSSGGSNVAVGTQSLTANTTGSQNTAVGHYALWVNSSSSHNTALGYGGLYYNQAEYNTAVGAQALLNNTTGSGNVAVGALSQLGQFGATTASSNTSVGYQSLYSVTTGTGNVAVGYDTMRANTTGFQNAALGYAALSDNTTGNNLTAVGYEALKNNTTGGENTAVGYKALTTIETGTGNVALGNLALFASTANNNTALGHSTLRFNTSGVHNTASGQQALYANTTGNNNTATGKDALRYNTTGGNNAALGLNSLYYNTTGHSNTAIGRSAQEGANGSATGSYNVSLGWKANELLGAGHNNIAIGASVSVADLAGDDQLNIGNLIIGDMAAGTVTISGTLVGGGASAINDLADAKHDTDDYSSLFLGNGAGANDDGTDNRNVGIGKNTLGSNTTGANNVSLGYEALTTNVSGQTNTAVGSNALGSNQTGSSNSAFGNASLFGNISGASNVAAGHQSMYSNTTGGWNVGIGVFSLHQNTTGMFSASNGYGSLRYNTIGHSNTAQGAYAQQGVSGNSTGSYNISLGFKANELLTTGNNNIAIGASVTVDDVAGDDQLNIGNLIKGSMVSGAEQVSLTGTLSVARICDETGNNCKATGSGLGASAINDLSDAKHDTDDYSSLFLGNGAGANDDGTDNANVAVGKNALNSNTSGARNVAVGYDSLSSNSTGSGNIAMGYNTLKLNTGGLYNIAIGDNTLDANTTGNSNLAMGSYALGENTTGASNLALAGSALGQNTTGSLNIALGEGAIMYNETGNYNVAVGTYASYNNTTGSSNSALGRQALRHNTTGHSNLALGHHAQYGVNGNSTGSYNISLGFESNELLTTGNNNIAIGASVTVPNVAGNDQLNIGNLILGDMAAGTVTISGTLVGGGASEINDLSDGKSDGSSIFFGTSAGANDDGSNSNIAIGQSALNATTSGGSNVAISPFSMNRNTTGSNNVAVGMRTLRYNTGGANNVALGYQAQYGVNGSSTGSYNVSLGHEANKFLSTGGYNIAIGAGASVLDATGSNQLNIGNTIYGEAISSTTAEIGINTNAPNATLDVSGTVKIAGTGSETCDGAAVGTFRFVNGMPQICMAD